MRIPAVCVFATCILCACIGVSSPAWAVQVQQGSAASPEVTCTQPLTVRIGESVMAGMILRRLQPTYPEITRMGRLSGTVVLHATVSSDGAVNWLQVVSGPMLLRESAVDAVRQWRYKPYMLNGKPVDVDTIISVVFKLDSGKNASAGGQSGGAQSAGSSPAQDPARVPSVKAPANGVATVVVPNQNAKNASAADAPIDAQFKANILKLLDLTHAMSIGHDAAARMLQSLRPTLIAALPPTPHREQIADAYGDKLTSLLTGPEMVNQLVEIYARHLSADDVSAMIQFYQTAAGQHSLAVLPQIMAESQQLGSNVAQENLPRILRELCSEFPELRGQVKFCPATTKNESSERMEKQWPAVSAQWSAERNAAERGPTAAHFMTVSLHRSVPVAQQSVDSVAVEAPESEMRARLIHAVPPVYPQIAVVAHVSGTVVLDALISSDGRTEKLTYISGPALLKDAAMRAVTQWKFRPYIENGVPVPVRTTLHIVFSLASPPKAIRLPENVMLAKLIQEVPPKYPAKAKAAQITGAVVLDTVVKQDGTVGKIRAVSGPPELVKAARDAVKKWKFAPTLQNGKFVPVETNLTVNFGAEAQ